MGQVEQPPGSELRCVALLDNSIVGQVALGTGYELRTFLSKYAADTGVFMQTVSSVNYGEAQRRAVTGDGVFGGITIQEAFAQRHGRGLLLPNVSMVDAAFGGGSEANADPEAEPFIVSVPSQLLGRDALELGKTAGSRASSVGKLMSAFAMRSTSARTEHT